MPRLKSGIEGTIQKLVSELKQEIARLRNEMDSKVELVNRLTGGVPTLQPKSKTKGKRGRRKWTPEQKRKAAEARRKWWADKKKS